ncbi:hypothetical protein LTR36_000671 [Oleoguttula mirabilis]|uniref:Uncharacterized protein n=1 Tax=Oleoguttula mirabilis TaxID=1507867 RepID=A0AAV9JQI8_9PEZI|nr:hypothetical protein LTR36_000671 [Oleoguttula mirabilis]
MDLETESLGTQRSSYSAGIDISSQNDELSASREASLGNMNGSQHSGTTTQQPGMLRRMRTGILRAIYKESEADVTGNRRSSAVNTILHPRQSFGNLFSSGRGGPLNEAGSDEQNAVNPSTYRESEGVVTGNRRSGAVNAVLHPRKSLSNLLNSSRAGPRNDTGSDEQDAVYTMTYRKSKADMTSNRRNGAVNAVLHARKSLSNLLSSSRAGPRNDAGSDEQHAVDWFPGVTLFGPSGQTPDDAPATLANIVETLESQLMAIKYDDCQASAAPTVQGADDVPLPTPQTSQNRTAERDRAVARASEDTVRPRQQMLGPVAVEGGSSTGDSRHDSGLSATPQSERDVETKKKKKKNVRFTIAGLTGMIGRLNLLKRRRSQDDGYEADDEQQTPDSALATESSLAEEERGRAPVRRESLSESDSGLPEDQQEALLWWWLALGL